MFEMIMVLITICYGLERPSIATISMILLSFNMLISATMEPIRRIKWALRINILNIVILTSVIAWKRQIVDQLQTSFSDEETLHSEYFWTDAKGFVVENVIEDSEAQIYKFTINKQKS
jgi:hypothetical protein